MNEGAKYEVYTQRKRPSVSSDNINALDRLPCVDVAVSYVQVLYLLRNPTLLRKPIFSFSLSPCSSLKNKKHLNIYIDIYVFLLIHLFLFIARARCYFAELPFSPGVTRGRCGSNILNSECAPRSGKRFSSDPRQQRQLPAATYPLQP